MDTWVRIGVGAAVIDAVIAVLGYFDITPFGLGAPWVWRFLFVSVTLFTWVMLYWIVQRQKKSKKEIVIKDEEIGRLNRVLKEKEEQSQSEKKLALTNSSPSLSTNEIIHPPDGGVLWRWDQKSGADGPFCPRHKSRLFYRDYYANMDRIENFDKHFLSGSGWFVCPLDTAEEFIFVKLGTITVGHLRERAAERLRVKLENELVPPS